MVSQNDTVICIAMTDGYKSLQPQHQLFLTATQSIKQITEITVCGMAVYCAVYMNNTQ